MITPDQVATHLKLNGPDDHLKVIVDSVNLMVNEWHGETWPGGVGLGGRGDI